jgi:SAM-dependent methyltransferase
MSGSKGYSGVDYWDEYHAISAQSASTRRTGERIWLTCFLPALERRGVRRILDLGCGSGADALALARLGYDTTGVDISMEALRSPQTEARDAGLPLRFVQHDIAEPLPFADAGFDAVISNLTLHMFPEPLARDVVVEVARCLVPGGLFLFHVNSTRDTPYRLAQQRPAVRLGDNFYRLGRGQTMRFYGEGCCRALLSGWAILSLEHVENRYPDGRIQKCAWRCIAEKPAAP